MCVLAIFYIRTSNDIYNNINMKAVANATDYTQPTSFIFFKMHTKRIIISVIGQFFCILLCNSSVCKSSRRKRRSSKNASILLHKYMTNGQTSKQHENRSLKFVSQ